MFGRKKKVPDTKSEHGNIKEVKTKKKKLNKKFLLLYIAGFVFLVYASYTIISQSVELNSRREELDSLNHQIEIVEIQNDYLETVKNYKDDDLSEYIENIAREDLDYVKNGERVFVNISGD